MQMNISVITVLSPHFSGHNFMQMNLSVQNTPLTSAKPTFQSPQFYANEPVAKEHPSVKPLLHRVRVNR